jgi:hypothetical protein
MRRGATDAPAGRAARLEGWRQARRLQLWFRVAIDARLLDVIPRATGEWFAGLWPAASTALRFDQRVLSTLLGRADEAIEKEIPQRNTIGPPMAELGQSETPIGRTGTGIGTPP